MIWIFQPQRQWFRVCLLSDIFTNQNQKLDKFCLNQSETSLDFENEEYIVLARNIDEPCYQEQRDKEKPHVPIQYGESPWDQNQFGDHIKECAQCKANNSMPSHQLPLFNFPLFKEWNHSRRNREKACQDWLNSTEFISSHVAIQWKTFDWCFPKNVNLQNELWNVFKVGQNCIKIENSVKTIFFFNRARDGNARLHYIKCTYLVTYMVPMVFPLPRGLGCLSSKLSHSSTAALAG